MSKFLVHLFTLLFIISFSFLSFSFVNAEPASGGGGTSVPTPTPDKVILKNPLQADSITCLIYDIANGVMGILAIVAALYIIYSGFLFVASKGSPDKISGAKRAFFNAVIGTGILLGAWAITAFVVNVISGVLADPNALPNITNLSC